MKLNNSFFCIIERQDTDSSMSYRIRLNAGHIIYQAHFPGKPITPGVCAIQMAIELLEAYMGRAMRLVEMKNIKFIAVLSPEENEEVIYTFNRISEEGNRWKTQLTVNNGDIVFAKMSITCEATRQVES